MTIKRSEAIMVISFLKMAFLTDLEKDNLRENVLSENDCDSNSEAGFNYCLRLYLTYEIELYSNLYLKEFLFEKLKLKFEIEGDEIGFECPCCGFRTLLKRFEYFICRVCFWEDDGSEGDNYSNVNGMTINEARQKFKAIGVISEICLPSVEPDRFLKYSKRIDF